MRARDIIVIGASAGGVTALMELASGLPPDLQAVLLVAVHTSPDGRGRLPELISSSGPLPAAHAVDDERFRLGRFYVAPPDRHLLVRGGTLKVTRGPRENNFRPAVDPLFRTAAESHGPRVVGIVLSGGLNDGTHGLQAIKREGGVTIVQQADDALFPSMPLSAIEHFEVDHVLPVREMSAVIARLASEAVPEGNGNMSRRPTRPDPAERGTAALQGEKPRGPLAPYTCPECGGALWEMRDAKLVRFACHTGHSFTAESLVAGQDDGVEAALWTAIRALEEKASMAHRLAERVRGARLVTLARDYEQRAESAGSRRGPCGRS